ncbi:flavin reductase family protein [Streptomyces achromogenes]|uniref:Flavin reductase family protein n=1 Tax=Streptomyces achromogenes TaxID=67255 RepID=A0ABZ1KVM2_STRAH|nr:flavin reductase family protein [Streptomyces achromogenes]
MTGGITDTVRGVDADSFRAALARFASGVVVVTARDALGAPHGFTASSFCSVSLRPPLVLVCLAETATSYDTFTRAADCGISILAHDQTGVARRFATRGADKFTDGAFETLPNGTPAVRGALATLACRIRQRHTAGDHMILVAEVTHTGEGEGHPMLYFDGAFRELAP